MISNYIVTPVLGAVIGYFTNWLAIKMIFKPYEEKRIFNIRVPFTPGLMPKERYILSKKVGKIISENLLTEEVMVKALISDDIHKNINGLIDKTLLSLEKDNRTLNNVISNIFINITEQSSDYDIYSDFGNKITNIIIKTLQQEQLHDSIIKFIVEGLETSLKKQIKDIPIENLSLWIQNTLSNYSTEYINSDDFNNLISDNIFNFTNNLDKSEKTIGEVIPEETIQRIKNVIYEKMPSLSQLVLTLIETPVIEEKMKEFIIHLIDENVGKLVTWFVSPTKVSESIVTSLKQYLIDENNYVKTSDTIITYLDKLSAINVNEITSKIPENYKNYPLSDTIVKTIRKFCNEENISNIFKSINEYMAKLNDKSLYDIIINIEPDIVNKAKKYIKEQLKKGTKQESLILYINKAINSQINNISNMTISQVMEKFTDDFIIKTKAVILKCYDFIIKKAMVNMLKAMNISKIVEDRINDFEIKEAEDIVLQVVNKELGAITMIGGLLGFIIGLLPAFMN